MIERESGANKTNISGGEAGPWIPLKVKQKAVNFQFFIYNHILNKFSIINNMNFLLHKLVRTYDTGLPTKDETSETTVQNLYCLLPHIYDSVQLRTCAFLCEII